MRYHHSPVFE
jgi:hypothetical protein